MLDAILATGLPTLGWAAHAAWLHHQLRAERHDPVTGLVDRRTWMRRTDRMLRRRTATAVLLLDLNDFKPVNDRFGHQAGDAVLKATAARLTDYCGPHALATRLGGDEFAVTVATREPEAFAAGLGSEIARPVPWPGGPLRVSASIGSVRTADLERPSASAALGAADEAMYAAKGRGRRGRRRLAALLAVRPARTPHPSTATALSPRHPLNGGRP
ncbi:GGDEF domain-containing protein [Streptomyces sp. NPDC001262]|uniref:GGDEF domain-containing protein n=1 Tax=Streptomyces sp. NPDC001262 TaxID=3364552 RepID=UPI0036A99EE3